MKYSKEEYSDLLNGRLPSSTLEFELCDRLIQLQRTPEVREILIAWEQFKEANWYESEAIDVEKMLMDKFQEIYGR